MAAGDSATEKAAALAAAEAKIRARADRIGRKAAAYAAGGDGERIVAELLTALDDYGWIVLADRCVPGTDANIDFIAIGLPGVVVIDAKNLSGTLTLDGLVLRQNGRRKAEDMERVRFQAAKIAEALDTSSTSNQVPTRPMLAFVGGAKIGSPTPVDRVHLVDGDDLVPYLLSFDARLSDAEVSEVAKTIEANFAPRTAKHEHSGDSGDSIAPPEPVVFLTPWRRNKMSRLYVRDELGDDGGHLDLKTGAVVGTSEAATSVLLQLLPHYLRGDAPGEMTGEESEAIQKFLDGETGGDDQREQPLVAGYWWKNYGRTRLYIHRLKPGSVKTDLGWFDLTEQRVHADVPGEEPAIRYCGEQYLATDTKKK